MSSSDDWLKARTGRDHDGLSNGDLSQRDPHIPFHLGIDAVENSSMRMTEGFPGGKYIRSLVLGEKSE
jgi:hypothetical protein